MGHRRTSHKQMSGEFAHLIGKKITWTESLDQQTWFEVEGKVKIIHSRTQAFTVEVEGTQRGVYTDDIRIRNIRVDGQVIFGKQEVA